MVRPKGRSGPSKADAIRQQLQAHPHAKVSEIVQNLSQKGIKVLANHVYALKTHARVKQGRQRRLAAGAAAREAGLADPIQAVTEVRGLAMRLGGMSHLKKLVDLLAE